MYPQGIHYPEMIQNNKFNKGEMIGTSARCILTLIEFVIPSFLWQIPGEYLQARFLPVLNMRLKK